MNVEEFKKKSFEKFLSSKPENSQLFKNDTLFMDFQLGELKAGETEDLKVPQSWRNVTVMNISKALEKSEFSEVLLKPADDKFLNLINSSFNSGFFIKVPDNIELEPLVIKDQITFDKFSKNLIMVGSNSKVKIILESASDKPFMLGESTTIMIKDNSQVEFSYLQNTHPESVVLIDKICYCGKDSKISWSSAYFGGRKTRSRTSNLMVGDGSMGEDAEMMLGDNEQDFDIYSNSTHVGKFTNAKISVRGIGRGSSRLLSKGMIKIGEQAKNANSFLSSHAMLMSKEAKADAIPSLEIENNEVRATHSASVYQIDDEKIFYLMSRGLDNEIAKKLMCAGFLQSALNQMPQNFANTVASVLDEKWGVEADLKFSKKEIFEGHYKYR